MNGDYGISGAGWAAKIKELIDSDKPSSVLDYGAGKGTVAAYLRNHAVDIPIAEYDPAIEAISKAPDPADLVICTDVLEHIEPKHLNAVLRDLARVTQQRLFFNISLRPSTKTLPDGRNAHLIVKSADWWREKLAKHFRIAIWNDHSLMHYVQGEAIPLSAKAYVRPTSRRIMHPDWFRMIDDLKASNHRYADAFARLNTFSMWEGFADERADMQIVMGTLENVDDLPAELAAIVEQTGKAALFFVPLNEQFPEAYWRRLFETKLRLGDWHKDAINGQMRLVAIGSPMIGVQGVTAFGAVASDDRWAQVVENSKRISARVQSVPEHARRAILACYGPSLRDTVDALRQEAAETDCVIVSVSGAHDFLIANGITPTYHVECDPRPHKALNIDRPIDGVEYLIASAVHKDVLDKLHGADIRLWHVSTPEHASRIIDELGESSDTLISGGGSVGLRSIPLLYNMGYRDISIYGMDCSFSDDGKAQWAGKHAGKRQDLCEVKCGERLFCSSPVLLTYATGFFEALRHVTDITFRLHGDGLLQAMCRHYQGIPETKNIRTEQDKVD